MRKENRPKTWMEIMERKRLEAIATEGIVSDEQVEAAVAEKKARIKKQNDLEQAVFDIQYETIRQALQGKNN